MARATANVRFASILFLLPAIVGVAAVAWALHARYAAREVSGPLVKSLRWLKPTVDLGEVWETDNLLVDLELVNEDRSEPFEITKFRSSCLCTSVDPAKLTVKPGGKATVRAAVDLRKVLIRGTAPEFSERIVAHAVSSSGGELLLPIVLTGTVRAAYQVTPGGFHFARAIKGESVSKSVEVRCLASSAARGLELVAVPQGVAATVERSPADPSAFSVVAQLGPDVPYGALSGAIRFRAQLDSGPFVTSAVPVIGVVVDDLHALPPSLVLGTVAPGEENSESVTLSSRRGERFTVLDVETSASAVRVQADAGGRYRVTLQALAEGRVEEAVRFRLRTEKGREHIVQIPVQAYVVRAHAALRERR